MVHDSRLTVHGNYGSRFMVQGSRLLLVHGSGQLMVNGEWFMINGERFEDRMIWKK